MKKKYICFITAVSLCFSSVPAFGAETSSAAETESVSEEENLYDKYSTYYTADSSSLPPLTLDEAIDKTLKNSTSVKTTNINIENLEDDLDQAGIEFSYPTSENGFSSLLSLISAQVNLKNSQISKDNQNENLKYSVKQSFIDIITAQREIAASESSLRAEEANLNTSKIKNRMGTLSDSDLKTQQLAYEKSVSDLESKKISLEADYISLNILMGVNVNNRYSVELPIEYEPFNTTISVESYVTNVVNNSSTIKQKENSLTLTQEQQKLSWLNSTEIGSYNSAQNSLNSAELSLQDTKDELSQTVRNLYNTIVQSEKSLETSIGELGALKTALAATETKYEMGTASKLQLEEAKQGVIDKENSIISALYTHMMNVEKLNNPVLM